MAAKKFKTLGSAADLLPVSTNDRGEFPIRIARDGTWYHEGSPIRRMALVRLLSTVLHRDDSGRYWLATPYERGRIQVEDAPFTAVEVDVLGSGPRATLRFRTNLDDWITAGPDHPVEVRYDPETGEPSPYITVRDGLKALILRPVFYALAEFAQRVDDGGQAVWRIWSAGAAFDLGIDE